jgi:uncharacterized membrane protein SpoIIM required for sporulation
MTFINPIFRAIRRARWSIAAVAAVYAVSVLVGILMVHTGNVFALKTRDQIVGTAVKQDSAAMAAGQGDNLKAALFDFTGNLFLGAVPKTVSGLSVIFPFPWVAYQGWVGGIVSVSGGRTSRFSDPRSAAYYLLTLLLQLSAYSICVGAGVNAGLALLRPALYYQGGNWLKIFPKEALLDIARIYAMAVPVFLIASLWEFFSPWNI